MTKKRIHVVDSKILIMGVTFKENCPDLRNTRVMDLIAEFNSFNCHTDVYDPWLDQEETQKVYGVTPIEKLRQGQYDAIILAVVHDQFKELSANKLRSYGKEQHILYDIKCLLKADEVDGRL
jgi:UDP-N-acetyl-D-glucosamine/UDP-N-acetyl-D-galactosamine dehydrogenase